MSDEQIPNIAVEQALEQIHSRSFAGRNPHLGKMINCAVCNLRHRENQTPKCEQSIVVELVPPEGLTQLTHRQIMGAKFYNRQRQAPRNRPKNKMHYWLRVILDARKKRNEKASDSNS